MVKWCNAQYLSVLDRGKDWSAFRAAHVPVTSLVLRASRHQVSKGESSNPKTQIQVKIKDFCAFVF